MSRFSWMRKQRLLVIKILIGLGVVACETNPKIELDSVQIAFMPDIHFHDIYADFNDDSFIGLDTSRSDKRATIRTMLSQLNSTRLFNENYFALLAALDDIASRGIKLVALPGDFSDDGQALHLRGLRKILDHYAEKYDLEFFSAPGNHDPKRPYSRPAGKPDYLGEDGFEQRIFSKGMNECQGYDDRWKILDAGYPLPTICSEEVKELGYQGVMEQLAKHGFYPKPNYLYWESPYSKYKLHNYDFNQALAEAGLVNRQYEICHQGTGGQYKKSHYHNCLNVPDASYLVEPVAGLWLLAIDANVYVPTEVISPDDTGSPLSGSPLSFSGSGNAGYNKMFSHKAHVVDWVESVVKRADAAGKKLIAFSHFPMIEFYDEQSDAIANIFGADNFQLVRRPSDAVSHSLAALGLKVHVGGHMHINDTGIKRNKNGGFLFNIQAPSIAAYVPAYKLLSYQTNGNIEVQTIVLKDIPRFNELFEHYHKEHQALVQQGANKQWNKAILKAASYAEFTQWHLIELTRQRFLPQEWPSEIRALLFALNGHDMLVLSQLKSPITLEQLSDKQFDLQQLQKTSEWKMALHKAKEQAAAASLSLNDFTQWSGFDLAVDFYRLRNADELALRDISQHRLAQYTLLTKVLVEQPPSTRGVFVEYFGGIFKVLDGFQHGLPNDHFILDMAHGRIIDLKQSVKAH